MNNIIGDKIIIFIIEKIKKMTENLRRKYTEKVKKSFCRS